MTVAPPRLPEHASDAEALIEEARQRQRRRRRWIQFCMVLVVIAAAAALVTTAGSPSKPKPPLAAASLRFGPNGPTVDAKAFAGEGDLAFVSRTTLWVLNGRTGSLQRLTLPQGVIPSSPTFSADGKWLAFMGSLTTTTRLAGTSTETSLWLARSDGADAHRVAGFDDPRVIGWSPRQDLLAVTNQGRIPTDFNRPLHSDRTVVRQTSLWLLSPSGTRRKVMATAEIDGATWSPDGSALAIGSASAYPFQDSVPWSSTLTTYPINGGTPTVWVRFSSAQHVPFSQDLILPVGWWSSWGIGFWAINDNAYDPSGLVGGGFPLWYVHASGQAPRPLGSTLAAGQVSPIVASSNGDLAFTNEPGNSGARPFWQNEQVESCSPTTLRCVDVAEPPGTISFDPVWSTTGSSLAYLVGTVSKNAGFDQKAVADWYNSLQLWLYSARTGKYVEATAAWGAVVPIWSRSDANLLYVAHDGLWLMKNPTSTPAEIVGPLLPPKNWNAYFAQINWTDQFAWSRA